MSEEKIEQKEQEEIIKKAKALYKFHRPELEKSYNELLGFLVQTSEEGVQIQESFNNTYANLAAKAGAVPSIRDHAAASFQAEAGKAQDSRFRCADLRSILNNLVMQDIMERQEWIVFWTLVISSTVLLITGYSLIKSFFS